MIQILSDAAASLPRQRADRGPVGSALRDGMPFRSRRDRSTHHDIQYLLTSRHPACRINSDISTGGFRLLNLQLPPYGLPEPLTVIDDWLPGHSPRHLAMWSREHVAAALRE